MSAVRKLEADEKRRQQEHDAVKGRVQGEVRHAIEKRAEQLEPPERAEVAGVAHELKHHALSEVHQTESEIERGRAMARVRQVVDYVFAIAYGIIGLEIVLELVGAREGSPFKRFMDVLSTPLLGPFRGLLPSPSVGTTELALPAIFALIVWILVHLVVRGLLHVIGRRETTL